MLKEYIRKSNIKAIERKSEVKIKELMSQCDIVPLTKGQTNDIQAYYKRFFGRKVPTLWHEYFSSRNGEFSVKYMPSSIYHSQIVWRLNYNDFSRAYSDKGFYDAFFHDVNRPHTIVKNINGYYYDSGRPISREEALERCKNLSGAVAKPTIGGMRGYDITVFASTDGVMDNGDSVEKLFDGYRKNFIIQERVGQHEEMARLNPSSLNTLRVLTYRDSNQVHVVYAIARIGRMGQPIDNLSSGGIYADVDISTGKIRKCAYGAPHENHIEKTDCGTVLDGFLMPSFPKVLSLAQELHLRLPYFNLIGWDFGVDVQGEPLLIEWNRSPDIFSQTAHGPAFGDLTDDILQRVRTLPDTLFLNTM
ncbi:MAG: hypothetical protein J5641_03635 [Bacteroidales bacterium]|nr:hypothetical protein [Bacteroidales bacterium]